MKRIFKILLIGILIIVGFAIYLVTTSDIFSEDKPVKMKTLFIGSEGYNLDFYYIPSNATSQSYVQLRKKYKNGKEIVFENYERYQGVGNCRIMNDTTLMITLLDSMSYKSRKDTVFVNLR